MDDGALRRIVAAASASGKVVAAICVAPAVLARAGALRNRRATCYRDARIIGVLKRDGAEYADETVVTSGAVVTANGPEAARDFSFRVLDALKAMSE
jgi:protease I